MFAPKYAVTPKLLANIKRIAVLASTLNHSRFPDVVLMEFERRAGVLSAYASTSIEGNPLPLTEVRKILKSQPHTVRESEREVLNYNKALKDLNVAIKRGGAKCSVALLLRLHAHIMHGLQDKFRCGKFRREPVFVRNPKTRKTVYWPPDHGDVPKLMSELVTFVTTNHASIDPLILAGFFHKQFVIIHPFMDGNGRTTRLATKAILANMGLDTFHLFSFENYYNQNVGRYFQQVGVKGNYYDVAADLDFTEWLEYFTDGMIDELLRVEKALRTASVTPDTMLKPYHVKLIDYIKQYGFIADADYAKLVDRAKATRSLDFKKLLAMKILVRLGKGKSTHYKLTDNNG